MPTAPLRSTQPTMKKPVRCSPARPAAVRGDHIATVPASHGSGRLRPVQPLASIPGQFCDALFIVAEPESEGAAVPLGDRGFKLGEPGVNEDGVVAAQVQRAGDAGVVDLQGAGGVEEVPP